MSLTRDRLVVTAAALVWVVGTAFGLGLVGTRVAEQGRGLFSDHATLIAPHGPAFSIWSVIYLGLAGYVVWQWLPAAGRSRWAGRTRIPAAATLALNGVWLLVTQAQWIWGSVVVIALLVAALGWLFRRVRDLEPGGLGDAVWVRVTFGLYLGWSCVATCANVALALVGSGVAAAGALAVALTVAVIAVVVGIAAATVARLLVHRASAVAYGAAAAWGLVWVAVGRFTGELRSPVVGGVAAVAAVVVVFLAIARRGRRSA